MESASALNFDNGFKCSVCLDDLGLNPTATKCGHLYHAQCIFESLKHRQTCPECRERVRESDLITIYLDFDKACAVGTAGDDASSGVKDEECTARCRMMRGELANKVDSLQRKLDQEMRRFDKVEKRKDGLKRQLSELKSKVAEEEELSRTRKREVDRLRVEHRALQRRYQDAAIEKSAKAFALKSDFSQVDEILSTAFQKGTQAMEIEKLWATVQSMRRSAEYQRKEYSLLTNKKRRLANDYADERAENAANAKKVKLLMQRCEEMESELAAAKLDAAYGHDDEVDDADAVRELEEAMRPRKTSAKHVQLAVAPRREPSLPLAERSTNLSFTISSSRTSIMKSKPQKRGMLGSGILKRPLVGSKGKYIKTGYDEFGCRSEFSASRAASSVPLGSFSHRMKVGASKSSRGVPPKKKQRQKKKGVATSSKASGGLNLKNYFFK